LKTVEQLEDGAVLFKVDFPHLICDFTVTCRGGRHRLHPRAVEFAELLHVFYERPHVARKVIKIDGLRLPHHELLFNVSRTDARNDIELAAWEIFVDKPDADAGRSSYVPYRHLVITSRLDQGACGIPIEQIFASLSRTTFFISL
jgi:hypothetical protein